MNRIFLLTAFLSFFIINQIAAQCDGGRYYDSLFAVSGPSTVQYGGNTKADGNYQNLYVDIYQPQGDTFFRRPLIILGFGGSFTFGFRKSPDIVQVCKAFAKKGYVTASIDYRVGFDGGNGNDTDTNQFKALMRAAQDMRASIRYFYKDALTANTFKIDTNQIFIGGVSAGGFTALNLAYGKADTLSRTRPGFVDQALLDVGGITGNSGNAGYSEKVKGVINLCGAIADTVWLMPGDPILCGVHGTADSLVPCYFDSAKAASSVEALMFGSGDLITRAQNVGIPHSLYLFKGADHVPFFLGGNSAPYMDTTINVIRDFLSQHTVCNPLFSSVDKIEREVPVAVYPNPANDYLMIASGFNELLNVEVRDLSGRMLFNQSIAPRTEIKLATRDFAAGMKLVYFKDETGKVRSVKKVVLSE